VPFQAFTMRQSVDNGAERMEPAPGGTVVLSRYLWPSSVCPRCLAFICVFPVRGEEATVDPPLVPRSEAIISAGLSPKGSMHGQPWSVSAVESQACPAQTDHVRAEDLVS
jgi:hypothetical protein